MPVSDIALLYRCNAHGSGICKSGTFQEDDMAESLAAGTGVLDAGRD